MRQHYQGKHRTDIFTVGAISILAGRSESYVRKVARAMHDADVPGVLLSSDRSLHFTPAARAAAINRLRQP